MKTIAIDFDGVIYDKPVEGVKESLQKLEKEGFELVVFTTRDNLDDVKVWMDKNVGWACDGNNTYFPGKITNKKPKAIAYIDDRAVRFTNWEDIRKLFC